MIQREKRFKALALLPGGEMTGPTGGDGGNTSSPAGSKPVVPGGPIGGNGRMGGAGGWGKGFGVVATKEGVVKITSGGGVGLDGTEVVEAIVVVDVVVVGEAVTCAGQLVQ